MLERAAVGSLTFAATVWIANVSYIAILRVFFGAQGKSSLEADVMIFGMMLGILIALGALAGNAVINLIFSVSRRHVVPGSAQIQSAIIAGLVAYVLIPVAQNYVYSYTTLSIVSYAGLMAPFAVAGAVASLGVFLSASAYSFFLKNKS